MILKVYTIERKGKTSVHIDVDVVKMLELRTGVVAKEAIIRHADSNNVQTLLTTDNWFAKRLGIPPMTELLIDGRLYSI